MIQNVGYGIASQNVVTKRHSNLFVTHFQRYNVFALRACFMGTHSTQAQIQKIYKMTIG